MLRAIQIICWLPLNVSWTKSAIEIPTTYIENSHHVQPQNLKPYEAFSPIRRNMY